MSKLIDNVSEFSTQKVVAAASYGTSISTAAGGALTVNQIALWGGLLFTLLTFVVNSIYRARQDRRDAMRDKRDEELNKLESELVRAKLAKELSNE